MKDRGKPPFPRYVRKGQCNRCGLCCRNENCEHFLDGIPTTCKIYGSPSRPLMCRLFPEMPPIPFKLCGYYFLDLWEDNKVVKRRL